MLPVVLGLYNQPVVVIGAGAVAASKIRLLLAEGARVTVISPDVLVPLPPEVQLLQREYAEGDLAGFRLAVVAVGVASVNARIRAEADERGTWLNVVDNPALCDFYFTAVHRDGDLVVSVSTQGAAPALAQLVRDHVAAALPSGISELTTELRARRDAAHSHGQTTETSNWKDGVRAAWSELFVRATR